jgi:Leucine-rich repeat (LRR) protein
MLLQGVAGLFPFLEILDIRHNQLESWESLLDVSQLKGLVELNMAGNPVTCAKPSDQSYHYRVAEICQSVEMVDEVHIRKAGLHTQHRIPVMRPMSAAQALSTRQVQEQIMNMESELESVQRDIESRLTALTTSWDLLSQSSPETGRPVTASRSASRCSSRSRILEAKAFANEHFNKLS